MKIVWRSRKCLEIHASPYLVSTSKMFPLISSRRTKQRCASQAAATIDYISPTDHSFVTGFSGRIYFHVIAAITPRLPRGCEAWIYYRFFAGSLTWGLCERGGVRFSTRAGLSTAAVRTTTLPPTSFHFDRSACSQLDLPQLAHRSSTLNPGASDRAICTTLLEKISKTE